MRIIKEGKAPEMETHTITCSRCATMFQFFVNEGTYTHRFGLNEYFTIQCPLPDCNKKHWYNTDYFC